MIERKGRRYAIEVKLRRDTQTEERALAQVADYLDSLKLDEGWLVMFDRRKKLPWGKRLFTKTKKRGGNRIHFIGC